MEDTRHLYSAFGINISSDVRIPELNAKRKGPIHAEIKYGSMESPSLPDRKYSSKVTREGEGFLCYIKSIGGVKVCDDRRIIVSPEKGAEEKGFRFLVSGIAIGLLLHLRGLVTLHASAVVIEGRAVAFVGRSGMGKSTTAAALHSRGHPIITDDLLVLDTTGGSVQAYPGFPHLKLTPESIVKSVNKDPDRIPKIDPGGPKHSFEAEKNFVDEPLPLQCMYVLDYKEDENRPNGFSAPFSEAITGKDACIELVRNSYVGRLLPEEAVTPHHLKRSAEIAQSVPVRRLRREKSLSALSSLAAFIEQEHAPNGRSSEA
ncbi:hypothetical protein [Salinibacter grassmerensis]|uniref:hypothetical protein n=1 Tax=Salinibacter grassmerensis TaxID=3040353 RepID=UPI0021E7FF67|nr:hypothetical protein [Salinibacter grassmerensis]